MLQELKSLYHLLIMSLTWGTHSQRPGVIPLTLVVKIWTRTQRCMLGTAITVVGSSWAGPALWRSRYSTMMVRWVILFLKFWENCIWCVPKLTFWVHWFQNYFGFCSMTLPSHVSHFCQRVLVLHHNGHTAPKFNWVITFMTFIIPQNLYEYHSSEPGTFQFERRGHLVKESCGEALLSVLRSVSLLFFSRIMNIQPASLYVGKASKKS